jgi:hypothetical protein
MITDLFQYLQQTQRFLREQRQEFENPGDLLVYINRARREVAGRTQCIRRLTPISGQIISTNVLQVGTGYTAPVAVITPPDFPSGAGAAPNGRQASATVVLNGGTINSVNIQDGGDGYFEPQITIVDPTGSGAIVTPNMSPMNLLQIGQEVYPFSAIDLSVFPGVDTVHSIKSAAVIYANYRYSLPIYSFSEYQAKIRQYPFQYQYVPVFASQYGQGNGGSFYAYPLPSQTYQWEFDCFCLPTDMILDNSVPEAIPQPWTDAVPYFAASLAYMELQNWNAAKFYGEEFDKRTLGYSSYARPGRAVNPYGRYVFVLGTAIPVVLEFLQHMGNVLA